MAESSGEPTQKPKWWSRRVSWIVLALVVLVVASVVVVLSRDSSDGGTTPTNSIWEQRWPVRGDLANDSSFVTEAMNQVLTGQSTDVEDDKKHALWAGHVSRSDGEATRHVIVAVESAELARETARPQAPTVLFDVRRSASDDEWIIDDRPSTAFDPSDPLVAIKALDAQSDVAVASNAYLLANDISQISVVRPGPDGALTHTSLQVSDGVARYSAPESESGEGPICDDWLVRVERENGPQYLPPWSSAPLEVDEPSTHPLEIDEGDLASLASATTTCGDGSDGFTGDRLNVTFGWLPTELGGRLGGELTLPDGRNGKVINVEVQHISAGRLESSDSASTLAFIPHDGRPATFGRPSVMTPLGDQGNLAVRINGLTSEEEALLIAQQDSDRLTTVPSLPTLAHSGQPASLDPASITLLGSISSPIAMTFLDASGQQPTGVQFLN